MPNSVTVELPDQHLGMHAEDVIAEFRFGDNYGSVTALHLDAPRIYVIGGDEDMPLRQAKEFALALLAAVFAAEDAR